MVQVDIQLEMIGGHIHTFESFMLSRVPCVGEHVGHVAGEGELSGVFRVKMVLHLLELGDSGCVAEVYAVEDKAASY